MQDEAGTQGMAGRPDHGLAPSLSSLKVLSLDTARVGAGLVRLDGGTDPFAAAVRASSIPTVIADVRLPDRPLVFVNDAFCRLTGYEREEVIGRNCRFLQGPTTDPAAIAHVRAAVAAAKPLEIDLRNHRKSGEPFWNRLILTPVRDTAGALAYYLASQVDVTLEREQLAGLENRNAALVAELADRLRAQQASEARLRFATHAGRLGIFELELRTYDLTASAMFKQTFGRDPAASFDYAELFAAVHPDDRGRVVEAAQHSIATGEEYNIQYRVVQPGGGIGWVEMRAQIVRALDGTPLRMAGVSLEITERRLTEERLRESEARFRDLADNISQLTWMAEPNGTIFWYNQRWCEYTGVTVEHMRGEGWVDVQHPDHIEHVTARFHSAIAAGLPWEDTFPLRSRDGDYRWFLSRAQPIRDAGGRILRWFGTNTDITEQREAEALLEARVAERTAALTQAIGALHDEVLEREQAEEKLRQAQKMEAVGQLTGGIAHDFNNMLQAIGGSLELMRRRVEQGRSEEVARFVDAAAQVVGRATGLTHRLLAFARRQTLQPKPINLDELIKGVADLIRRTVGPSIATELRLHDGSWPVLCDGNQLESALLNLAINARDAMPAGGTLIITTVMVKLGTADVAEHEGAAPGDYVEISVADTGAGMDEVIRARAFEPFFTTKPLGEGTGLGLSQLYGFVRQTGGLVRLESALGRGTTVRLYLPRHTGTADASDAEGSGAPAMPGVAGGIGGIVLVVEDEEAVRAIVAESLRELGCRVLEASDGSAGLRMLQSHERVDALVTDVGLPGLNGRQLADAAQERWPGLPVLLITGYAGGAIEEALPAGMEVICKPFALDALASRVRAMVAARPAGDAGT